MLPLRAAGTGSPRSPGERETRPSERPTNGRHAGDTFCAAQPGTSVEALECAHCLRKHLRAVTRPRLTCEELRVLELRHSEQKRGGELSEPRRCPLVEALGVLGVALTRRELRSEAQRLRVADA